MITIDVHADVICPWCHIGKRRLEKGIALTGRTATVRRHPFESNPSVPPEGTERRAYRINKFGSWERSLELGAQVGRALSGEGLAFTHGSLPDREGDRQGGAVGGSGNRFVVSTTLTVPGVVFPEPCRVAERALPARQTCGCVSQIW